VLALSTGSTIARAASTFVLAREVRGVAMSAALMRIP